MPLNGSHLGALFALKNPSGTPVRVPLAQRVELLRVERLISFMKHLDSKQGKRIAEPETDEERVWMPKREGRKIAAQLFLSLRVFAAIHRVLNHGHEMS
jgi:hypothetical protein